VALLNKVMAHPSARAGPDFGSFFHSLMNWLISRAAPPSFGEKYVPTTERIPTARNAR
jgi:hypothetical protein